MTQRFQFGKIKLIWWGNDPNGVPRAACGIRPTAQLYPTETLYRWWFSIIGFHVGMWGAWERK